VCGIAGWVGATLATPMERLLAPMAHRGPDDWGGWLEGRGRCGLGQRRLAIIDLSPGGHQPMTAPGVPGWVVFNGEIYNYRELRADLAREGVVFHTQSDTEVILQMYRKHGPDMLDHLNGIFALAIWDETRGQLFCARDPLGTKPFYWTRADGRFLFASEVKVLLGLPGVEARVDPQALAQHLAYVWCPSPASAFRGIQKLEPGHRMWVDADGRVISDESYFTWDYREDDRLPLAARIEATREQVLSAVQRQLVSDVPVGLFLSGGLDSSAIAAAYRRAAPDADIEAFCSVTEAGEGFVQDLPYARKVADHLGIRLHTLEVKRLDLEHWKALLWHLEEPQADPAVHHVDQIARLAREQGLKVLLSGAGGDDLFSGYRRHQLIAQERLRMALPGFARRGLSHLGKALPRGSAFLRRAGKALDGMELDTPQRIASLFEWLAPDVVGGLLGRPAELSGRQALARSLDSLAPGTSPLNQMLFMETRGFLPDHNLNYTDKLSMAHGVETRVPLLDLALVAHANALPVGDKLHGTTTKWIFKKAMEPLLPHEVIYRPKAGFGAPLRTWLAGPMKADMEARLAPDHLRQRGWFDPTAVQRLWRDTLAGRVDGTYALWTVVTVDLWAEAFHVN
jgi:asparagine synthase (glutamine-hydrolysing)